MADDDDGGSGVCSQELNSNDGDDDNDDLAGLEMDAGMDEMDALHGGGDFSRWQPGKDAGGGSTVAVLNQFQSVRWFQLKSQAWRRDLVRRPWVFPVAAMHVAAITIQQAWRPCWLRHARPADFSVARLARATLHAKAEDVGGEATVVDGPEEKEARCALVRKGMQDRYLDLLKRQYVQSAANTDAEAGKLVCYPSYEHFVAALIQGFVRHRGNKELSVLFRVRKYMRRHYYHVAAFEIQSAWRTACQRWEMRLLSEELLRKQGRHQVAHARVYAAVKIQQAFRKVSNYRIYFALRDIVAQFRGTGDPYLLLRSILPREAMLLDPAMQTHVRFRLGGARFPPSIYYKIFTHGNVCDLGSFAPRAYAAERMGAPRREEDRYLRFENNGWRPLIVRLQPGGDPTRRDDVERATSRKLLKNFHHSRLLRRQDVERKRKQRSVDWMRKLYTMPGDEQEDGEMTLEDFSIPPSPSFAVGAPSATGGVARKRRLETKLTPRPPVKPPTHGRPRPANRIHAGKKTSWKQLASNPRTRDVAGGEILQMENIASGSGEESLEDLPDDMLLEWSKKLDFDAYMDGWAAIATSDCSEGTLPIGAEKRRLGVETTTSEMFGYRSAEHALIDRVHG